MTKQRKSGKRPPAKKAPVKASASGSSASSVSLPALGSRRAWSATARFGAVIVAVACVLFYMNIKDVYEAQNSALAATESNSQVTVERGDAALAFRPVEGMGDTGFIFYPGGKVEYEAYAPLMQQMAQRGIFCVLVEMPFELAILEKSAAGVYPADYPEITNWVIGGHDMGGRMAASYAAKNAESLSGLVLLGAYSSKDLTQSCLPVLSITAELDTVVDENKMERNRENLPEDTLEKTIAGGNHSGFGDYGLQEKDTQATITAAQQQEQTAQIIADWIAALP